MPVEAQHSAQIAVYGVIPRDVLEPPADSSQCSPQVPGSVPLSAIEPGSLDQLTMHAPPSTIERQHVLALGLRALKSGAPFTVLATNKKGGTRLAKELAAFGCDVSAAPRRRHQIVDGVRPKRLAGIDAAIAAGEPRHVAALGLWSQPGLFSWDHVDPGSQLLIDHLPRLAGRGADLGCGYGLLSRHIALNNPACHMLLVDHDCRALECARRNIESDHIETAWADIRRADDLPRNCDFVVMNPPFHDGGKEDRALGEAFIRRAAQILRNDGALWLTANRHLPYEAVLNECFRSAELIVQKNGYKIYMARK